MLNPPPGPRPGRPAGSRSFDAACAAAFGEVLRATRLQAGLSQEAAAHDSGIGRDHFSRLERGLTQPTLFAMLRIAAALSTRASELVEQTERAMSRNKRRAAPRQQPGT